MNLEGYLGYIKYDGHLVKDGVMDAKKQADALLGIDFAVRHFLHKLSPNLKSLDFEIPVKVREGSWEALIPETVFGWLQAGIGLITTTYAAQAAQKMAEKDFENIGMADLFRKALEVIKYFVRIGKHMGSVSLKTFENVKFSDDNALVGIKNSKGEYLYVPKYILDIYVESDFGALEKLASLIEDGRVLKVASIVDNVVDEVEVGVPDKYIFCSVDPDDEGEILFPELKHGQNVILEGEVTRENKTSNSMGFKYLDHILTAYPDHGSIVRYKPLLFLRCRLYGTVDRSDDKSKSLSKRPRLYISHLEPMESDREVDLFS
ncbi:hypothetical protein [Pseudomonas sp. RL_15y_Pfl2_60]|uniref:hypothetical protein n=1 Tax=Pseudomonas sp. RL_15y_Pfl2_60 TaxID=3088709 RepID=UPI0030D96D1C